MALVRAGQEKEGQQRMEQAHWLPLGNEAARYAFLTELAARGHTRDQRRECDLLFRLSAPGSGYAFMATIYHFADAWKSNDPTRTRSHENRFLLAMMRAGRNMNPSANLVTMPTLERVQEISAFLVDGKIDKALPLLARSGEMQRGLEFLAVAAVPRLEMLGKKQEADALFRQTMEFYRGQCQEYPGNARAHNEIAWTSAGCKRNLDAALDHALKAVELAPSNTEFLMTLSEVYFQRGDKGKALETIGKALALEPYSPSFRKASKRIETGDPKTPMPLAFSIFGSKRPLLYDEDID